MEGGSSGRWSPSLKGDAAVCQSSRRPTGGSWGQEKVDRTYNRIKMETKNTSMEI